jgi:hypothetical protein
LPETIVTMLLADCVQRPGESYNLLGELFRQMASPQKARGGRFVDVDYFNGGLFEIVDPVELKHGQAHELYESALRNDWSQVKREAMPHRLSMSRRTFSRISPRSRKRRKQRPERVRDRISYG